MAGALKAAARDATGDDWRKLESALITSFRRLGFNPKMEDGHPTVGQNGDWFVKVTELSITELAKQLASDRL